MSKLSFIEEQYLYSRHSSKLANSLTSEFMKGTQKFKMIIVDLNIFESAYVCLILAFTTPIIAIGKSEYDTHLVVSRRSSRDIDTSLNELQQDDPRLIEIIKNHYLHPPSRLEYNFSHYQPDLNGQFSQPTYIADTFFEVRMATKYYLILTLYFPQKYFHYLLNWVNANYRNIQENTTRKVYFLKLGHMTVNLFQIRYFSRKSWVGLVSL